MTHRQKTLRPIIERLVDSGEIDIMAADLWAKSYPEEEGITTDWILGVVGEREIHNRTKLPPNADTVFCEGK